MEAISALCVIFLAITTLYIIMSREDDNDVASSYIGAILAIVSLVIGTINILTLPSHKETVQPMVIEGQSRLDIAIKHIENAICTGTGQLRVKNGDKVGAFILDEDGSIRRCIPSDVICYQGFLYKVDDQGFPYINIFDKETGYKRCGAESNLE